MICLIIEMGAPRPSILSLLLSLVLLYFTSANSDAPNTNTFLQCLSLNSHSSLPISSLIFTPTNSSYPSVLQSYIRNLRFNSSTTPKPSFIITPTHISHIQASIICSKIHGLQIRIRSGGHDYDGLSYTSDQPFAILDMFRLRSIVFDSENATVWIDSGATLGQLYYQIAKQSKFHGFPAGVCPTVGVGGHFSGGGYGNLMRKYGLSVDNVVDAIMVDASGNVLDRETMGEDLFWAIRGGGGASFGVIVSWKINLVIVPKRVSVFRLQMTLEQGVTDIVYKWQLVANEIDDELFIRVVVLPSINEGQMTIKAKFVALFLGNAQRLFDLVNEKFPELGLQREECLEMSWVESVLFWANYANGTSADVLLDRMPQSEKFLKKKSDYVQIPISKDDLEGIWKKMMELEKPAMTFNPYGGRMSEILESETPFPHRAGNVFKIQYSVTWKEGGDEAAHTNLNRIRKLYDYMTPYVSNSPRASYLNYRDVDLGVNQMGSASYSEARIWGNKYFKSNFDRLVYVKSVVDPEDFFTYEQSIPSVAAWRNSMLEE
ncbi:Berberine bridge enzyme-like [Actinidia chinensis var. chinensis]|uniref:Berberine bridge enzyme-like n=1 Tax=Actinidia chinensis var. chinensis TaxID=1590841 RepID=A0A2R6RFX4_ACTCC|nr:Berberine bridge enzyme-like [Actinidia chinensis var. chinensis]